MVSVQKECFSSLPRTTTTIKEPNTTMSLRLFACGVYTFTHWFILVPLLWNVFTYSDWHNLWFLFYEIVAFIVWLIVVILILNLKCCGRKETESLPLKNQMNSNPQHVPQFQTSVSHVQPKETVKLHDTYLNPSRHSGEGNKVSMSLCSFPVQPQNTQINSGNETKENISGIPNANTQETVMESWKSTPSKSEQNILENTQENQLSDNDSVFEVSKCDTDNSSSPVTKTKTSNKDMMAEQRENVQLLREESYVGLPEMNSFDSYLQLVTVETPFSPGEEFFPDLPRKSDIEDAKATNIPKNKIPGKDVVDRFQNNTLPVNVDLVQEFINREAQYGSKIKNSDTNSNIPVYNEDRMKIKEIGSSEPTELPSSKTPPPNATINSKKESLGECFIADVYKNESIVSEVFISVDDFENSSKSCDTICVNIVDEVLKHNLTEDNSSSEGRWAVLK